VWAVLELVLAAGAPAGPGEFSQRAFLNGRLDLHRRRGGSSDMITAASRRAAHTGDGADWIGEDYSAASKPCANNFLTNWPSWRPGMDFERRLRALDGAAVGSLRRGAQARWEELGARRALRQAVA